MSTHESGGVHFRSAGATLSEFVCSGFQVSASAAHRSHHGIDAVTSIKMWMVRGDSGRLYDAFQERGIIAIGWSELIEAKPGMSRKELAEIYARARPDLKQGTINSGASQVWRFINEVAIEDFCITYHPTTRKYAVGKVTGDFDAKLDPEDRGVALLRKVKWIGEVNRVDLGTQTKSSLQSTLTLFQVPSSAANEVLGVLKCGHARAQEL